MNRPTYRKCGNRLLINAKAVNPLTPNNGTKKKDASDVCFLRHESSDAASADLGKVCG